MLGVPLLLAVALLIITVLLRWGSKSEDNEIQQQDPRKEIPLPIPIPIPVTIPVPVPIVPLPEGCADYDVGYVAKELRRASSSVGVGVGVPSGGVLQHECAVCYSLTSTRCARCKAVRYCSSKCQIIHWREGHKYECEQLVSSVSEKDDSRGNPEAEANGLDSADVAAARSPDEDAVSQMHSDLSESNTPIKYTVPADSPNDSTGPNLLGKNEGPVLNSDTPNMVQEEDESRSPNLKSSEKTVKKLVRDISRQRDRPTRSSDSKLSPGYEMRNSFDAAVSSHPRRSKSRDIPVMNVSADETVNKSPVLEHKEGEILTSKRLSSNSLPTRSRSNPRTQLHSGFKSSVQKVVQQLKSSHQKKGSPVSSLIENSEPDNSKVVVQYDMFKKLYLSKEVTLKPFGLVNCGNSCYANAILQCLAYTRPLTLYLLQRLHSKECWREGWCFICEFEQLLLSPREGHSVLSPARILSNISHLGHGRQEDAHEFLRYAVDTMQSICMQLAGVIGQVAEDTTLIGRTFGGYLHSKIKCLKCHYKSQKYERMMDLTVEIDGDIRTLEQALKRFTASEILGGDNKYFCSRCKSYEKAKKKLSIFQAPNILTIVLKRFQAGSFTKLKKLVQFPEVLNMTRYTCSASDRYHQYNLYAVVVHLDVMDAAISGHYVCYVKAYRGEWLKIDDSVVMSVDLERVLSDEAYILLYARDSPLPPASIRSVCDNEPAKISLEAVPSRRSGKSATPMPSQYTLDAGGGSVMTQHRPSRSRVKDPSYVEDWISSSVESIAMGESSSEVSSLFSPSEEGTCSTPSTRDTTSMEDYSDYIFGKGGFAG